MQVWVFSEYLLQRLVKVASMRIKLFPFFTFSLAILRRRALLNN